MEPKISGFGLSVQGQRFMSKPKPIKVDYAAGNNVLFYHITYVLKFWVAFSILVMGRSQLCIIKSLSASKVIRYHTELAQQKAKLTRNNRKLTMICPNKASALFSC
ncbi:hypothetical protein V8G54_020165 [Vigna mungo]|uniref:Uncharacterized protein n=1 Tax=Vigna mungo TaxID=3915 RepID=A0AAQ3RT31_VIGMU